jgi:glycerophosphoryl diester phosphodiesterase
MRINKDCWLLTKPIAHRGLWGGEIIENSLSAYQNAIDNGFPIEIDVFASKDGELVCFHDNTLKRMTGDEGFIHDRTLEQLKSLRLNGSNCTIPTFEQVLTLCENKVPLLIEIKDQPDKNIVEKVVDRLKKYRGEFAIQSFNPIYMLKVKKLAPDFIRGILGTAEKGVHKSPLICSIVKNMSLNFIIKPDFISYRHLDLPLKKSKTKNIPVICWTVTDKETANTVKSFAQNYIFEHFTPNNI